jgi:uncharacterized protein (DUF433 family)
MIETPAALSVPLRTDKDGVIRIGNTRVTLTTLIAARKQGYTAEQLHSSFPTVPLADIYAVIAYYLVHTEAVDEYVRQEAEEGEQLRAELETQHPEMFTMQKKMRALLEDKRKDDPS